MTRPARSRPLARAGVLGTVVGVLLAALALLASPASAQEPAEDGWVRLAHLSPDTPAVDVSLTPFGDRDAVLGLEDVAYGDVSGYQRVPAGTYTAAMLPAGGDTGDAPVITQVVTVGAGQAYTVAALGANAELTAVVLTDDLTAPAEGESRVRLLQASVSSPTVTVQAAGGPLIAQDAAFGSATGYAGIQSGVWTVQVADAADGVFLRDVTVQPGTVNTLIVLDRDEQLFIEATVDSAGVGAEVPAGGVETGGGSTATAGTALSTTPVATPAAVPGLVAGAVLLLAGAVLLVTGREAAGR